MIVSVARGGNTQQFKKRGVNARIEGQYLYIGNSGVGRQSVSVLQDEIRRPEYQAVLNELLK